MQEILISYLPFMKVLHIVGFVGWFGGIFYLVRIFVYHVEAWQKSKVEQEVLVSQYSTMEERAYRIICVPGMAITWIFGAMMLMAYGWTWLANNEWMQAKLGLLVLLTCYTLYCKQIVDNLAKGKKNMTSFGFRLFNEVPTILLLAIVLLAVYRNTLDFAQAFMGIFIFAILIYFIAKGYKSIREKG